MATATCPACKRVFDVPAGKAGASVECPECFEVFKPEKPGGPKIKVVITHGPPPAKGKKRRRDDDDDDEYEHDHRRDADDDDDDDQPQRTTRRVYHGIRPPGVVLTLGILSVLFICIPIAGILLAIATLSGPSVDVYHPADRGTVRTGKWLARATLSLYLLAVLAALGYITKR